MLDPILGYRYFETLSSRHDDATECRTPLQFLYVFLQYSECVISARINPIFRREFRKILCCAQRRNAMGVSARVVRTIQEGRQGSTLPVVFTSERS